MIQDEPARVTFYSVDRCGFYTFRGRQPEFGGLAETCSQLAQWAQRKPFSLTKLSDPVEGSDLLPVYLLGIIPMGEDWLLGCWNQTPARDGRVTSISMNSRIGRLEVHESELEPGTIPGFATYFWIVPRRNVVATVTFDGAAAGRAAMQSYLRDFLAYASPYVVEGADESGDDVILGYTDQDDGVAQNLHPRFLLHTYAKGGQRAHILARHTMIKKVIRVGHITLENQVQRNNFQRLVSFLRGDVNQNPAVGGTRAARVELEYTPSREELVQMMEAEDADETGERSDDLGFVLRGEQGIYWLSKSRASDSFTLTIDRTGEMVDLQSIADTLMAQRAGMLRLLRDA